MTSLHLNCDAGEDDALNLSSNFQDAFRYISAANIACGAHAGSERIISKTTSLCLKHNVQIGLHPSYDDRPNFGRKVQKPSFNDLYETVFGQLRFAGAIVTKTGGRVIHIKPHGALYNQTAKDVEQCKAVYKAIKEFDPEIWVYGLPGTVHEKVAAEYDLKFCAEGFGDRSYQNSISLRSRRYEDCILTVASDVVEHVERLIAGKVVTIDDGIVDIQVDTVCVHGDNINLLSILQALHKNFEVAKS